MLFNKKGETLQIFFELPVTLSCKISLKVIFSFFHLVQKDPNNPFLKTRVETSGQLSTKLEGLEHGWRPVSFPQGCFLGHPEQVLDVRHPGQQLQVPRRDEKIEKK